MRKDVEINIESADNQSVKLGFKKHSVGDITLVITDYTAGDSGVILTQPFANAAEVNAEFAKLERMIAVAKKKALQMVDPAEQGVSSAHKTISEVLKKVDPASR